MSVAQWARVLGLPAAQTEQSTAGRRHRDLWNGENYQESLDLAENLMADLIYADASAWEMHTVFGGDGSGYVVLNSDLTGFSKPVYYWALRQFMHYVRPGAVRVALTASAKTAVQAAAFVSPQGRPVIVLLNRTNRPAEVHVTHLPAGQYNIATTTRTRNCEEEAPRELRPREPFRLLLPEESMVTIWQR